MGAAADCETIGAGFLGQPVNSLTTIAFLVAGVVLIGLRPGRKWVGIGLAVTGLGSFLFHGPMPPGSEWAHDVSLAWLITMVAGLDSRWERLTRLPALLALAVVFAVFPVAADPVAVVLTALAVLAILSRDRSRPVLASLLLLAALAVFGRLGATGGPLCDPGSVFQAHGVWHLGAASTGAWLALVYADRSATNR
ncbi:MAG TPA: hypothetical protein VK990_05295 [Acidimicrobiia bacterium]|nr:hypothetical protein [Acidimicrobiia bacterium]